MSKYKNVTFAIACTMAINVLTGWCTIGISIMYKPEILVSSAWIKTYLIALIFSLICIVYWKKSINNTENIKSLIGLPILLTLFFMGGFNSNFPILFLVLVILFLAFQRLIHDSLRTVVAN